MPGAAHLKGDGLMTRCKVCKHPDINEINEKLVSGLSPREMANEYNLNHMSLYRHKEKHLPLTLIKAQQLQEQDAADDLLDRVESIYNKAWELVNRAEEKGSFQPAVSALKECRSCLELIGKLVGELKTGSTVNIHYNPQWVELRGTIFSALEEFPEARLKLAEKLSEVEEVIDGDVIEEKHGTHS